VEGIDRGGDVFSVKCLRYVGDRPDVPLEEIVLRERPREKGLFLDLGAENWLPLYPFIPSKASSDGEVRETYFVDAWNTKEGVARMKGFDSGDTNLDEEVAEMLAKWTALDEGAFCMGRPFRGAPVVSAATPRHPGWRVADLPAS
jgi:hypothetical protein